MTNLIKGERFNMKRQSVISTSIFSALIFILMIFCFSPCISYADAPQDVKLEYNSNTQTLAVTIAHKASFPGIHHIKSIEIRKNGVAINTTKYDTQPGKSPFTYTYNVAAAEGDNLEVTATCNMSGSKTAAITAPKATK